MKKELYVNLKANKGIYNIYRYIYVNLDISEIKKEGTRVWI